MEKPNLTYIKKLAGNDFDFEKTLLNIIKTEFPEEKKQYNNALKNKNYLKVAEHVHKIKHKISILGLEKSYEIAIKYENELRDGNASRKDDFEYILQIITNYLIKL